MKRVIIALGAALVWVWGSCAATHTGVQLWENGPYWATTNLGADAPTGAGSYFWWGDTVGYQWQNSQWVASDGSATGYSFTTANCPTYGKTLEQLQTMGVVGEDGNLLPAYDAATQQWGDEWRVPKMSEIKNLGTLCSWSWTTNSGVLGWTVKGQGLYSGNSVFLPVTGYGTGTTTNSFQLGYYWSSSVDAKLSPRLYFTTGTRYYNAINRQVGFPVRPVKSPSAARSSASAVVKTRSGTREVSATEWIAYDAAWGDATSGTLTVNGTAVSGLLSAGTYTWKADTSKTNAWALAYKAGTISYSANFHDLSKFAITYVDTKGAANANPAQYNILDSITFTALTNVAGYVFKAWNPTKIAAGGFGAKTVTAQWTPITYAVKFNANGGTGTMANESFTYGTAKALTANAFTRTGYTFQGWAKTSGATSAAYTDKQSVSNLTTTANGTVTLYAVWKVNTYTVKYNANGGSGSMASLACTYGQNATLAANAFTRAGYAFVGWMTAANGTTVAYTDATQVKNLSAQANATVNLYAKWTDRWYVNATAGDDANEGASADVPFKTIQHAVDKAVAGMTVIVADGTYAPINTANKAFTIQSVNGAEKTIIDGGYPAATNRCVYAGGTEGLTNTVMRGFTIQNGCTLGSTSGLNGAGVAGGTLYDCVVRSNHGANCGGGAAHTVMFNCTIADNETAEHGGGTYRGRLTDCRISGNVCLGHGGGSASGVLNNCTVISNRAEKTGGGVAYSTLTNCVVSGNEAITDGGGAASSSLYGCTVIENIAWVNGGGAVRSSALKCVFRGNQSYRYGGGVVMGTYEQCEFVENTATSAGGGAGEGNLNRCVVRDNRTLSGSGGGCSGTFVDNCLIYGNSAPSGYGGGVHKGTINNCVVYGNSAVKGGGVDGNWGVLTNNNSIVWGNTATQDPNVETNGVVSHCCFTNDPHFIRAAAGDFRLRCDSPCIDAGDKSLTTNTVDFAGNSRVVNGQIDIGAYEFSTATDTNFTVQVANGMGGAIYYEGDSVTISAEDRSPRYTFVRWTGDVAMLANANSMTNTFTMPARNLSFTAEYDDLQQYLVIDLSGGTTATNYPVSYLTEVPAGGWTDEYKTTKLVLRRIDPGTFTMGSPTNEVGRTTNEAPHQVTLSHGYYIGVFELTQRQWELVMGTRPSYFTNETVYATRPVERVTFDQIRGKDLGTCWPQMNTVDELSFMGRLRARTGRLFDLPTEAQWEYACRAGTTTALNSGKALAAPQGVDANMNEVGRYYYNSGTYDSSYDGNSTAEKGTAKVGSYLPNNWGLYDMHGNVGELCLDWYRSENSNGDTDPVGPASGTGRSVRCGGWGCYSFLCRSAARLFSRKPDTPEAGTGLRPVINLANFSLNQVVNVSASDGTDPDGVLVTWTALPGAEQYRVYRSSDSSFQDSVLMKITTDTTYLNSGGITSTNVYWYAVRATVDGKLGKLSACDSGYRAQFALTVVKGTGSTNCYANIWVPIKADTAPTGYSFKAWTGDTNDVARLAKPSSAVTLFKMPGRAVTLTATYAPNAYTVKFNANGGTGTVANEAFTYAVAKALTANAFTRTGYTYQGWGTSAAGAKVYADKQTVSNLTATANGVVNLYAVWKANAYTVKFNANGGTGTMANEAFTYDSAKALTANAFSRVGYTYQGWATESAGEAVYANGQTVSNLTATANGTVNLHAVWTANPFTVTFDANGGAGTAMAAQTFAYGTAQNLSNGSYTKTGYTFVGWSTDKNATRATYENGASVSNLVTSGSLALYAVWRPNVYTIRFQANGAEGAMADQEVDFDAVTNLAANAFAKNGYGFVGWCVDGETAISYTNRQTIINLATNDGAQVTLYAKWTNRWYVDAATGDDANEGTSAVLAFRTIQRAIDRSEDGQTIIVADGTYAPINSNNKSITIQSVNGAEKTIIDGGYPAATNRCVFAGSNQGQTNTVIRGFTIQNGCTIGISRDRNGAGVSGCTLYDCVVTANHSGGYGGGVYEAVATRCTIVGNTSVLQGGGVMRGVYNQCEISENTATTAGGGASGGAQLNRCVVRGNVSLEGNGGGACDSFADNCIFYANRASAGYGGGFHKGVMNNCVVYGNTASRGGGVDGYYGVLTNNNSIVWGNTATQYPNVEPSAVVSHNCYTGDPLFVDAANGDFRLKGASPCVDMGNNKYVTGDTDLRGNARVQNGVVDIGAYEFTLPTQLGNVPVAGTDAAVPVEWLGAYGYVDEDSTAATLQAVMAQEGDNGVPLWSSWVAGLDPWDPDSQLQALIEMVDDEPVVTWTPDMSGDSVKRHYTVMGKTNLTDTAWVIPVNEAHRFFKVAVTMGEPGLAKEVVATDGTSAEQVSISWHTVDQAVGYNVYRSTANNFEGAVLVASVSDTAFVDTTAVPGTRYYYWIVSVANGGEWVASESVTGSRSIGVPQHVAASDGTSSGWITVKWDAVEGAVSYRILRATTASEEDVAVVGTSAGTSWTDQHAAAGITYYYWVVAVGSSFASEKSSPDAGCLRLAAPDGVTASNGSWSDRVDVSWNAVEGGSYYRVYRSASSSGSKTAVSGWQAELTYSDTTAEPGATYYYFVAAAADAEGTNASGYSAGVVGSLQIAVPTGVYATDGTSETGVTVSWTASTGAAGYTVYRGTAADSAAASVLASTADTTVDDATALPGTLYYYWIVATNAVSTSAKSEVDTGYRQIPAPTGVSATTVSGADAVTISWQPVDGAICYVIYRGTKSGESYAVELDSTLETTYADESGAAGKTYYYSVKAVGASSESAFSAFVTGKR